MLTWVCLGMLICGFFGPHAQGALIISEFMADNRNGLRDAEGDHSDWLEVENLGAAPVELTGWFLTDDPKQLDLWAFPSLTLLPNQRVLVFASGKNRRHPGLELHTNFQLSKDGGYLALVRPDGHTIESAFAPSYPPQRADVSYGYAKRRETASVTSNPVAIRYRVPQSSADLPLQWVQPEFQDSSWLTASLGIGFDVSNGGIPATTNYARGRSTSQSSTAGTFIPGLAVDGKLTNYTQTASGQGSNAFWEVTLANPVLVDSITLYNRSDCCQDRLRDLIVSIRTGATGLPVYESPILNPANVDQGPSQIRIDLGQALTGRVVGNRVRVTRVRDPELLGGGTSVEDGEVLSLAEVDVQGTAIPTNLTPVVRTDVSSQMAHLRTVCALRVTFDDPWGGALTYEKLTLKLRFNDGFVAYLNGTEVARQNAVVTPQWDSMAVTNRAKSISFGFDTFDLSAFSALLRPKNNVLAIQGFSSGLQDGEFLLHPILEATAAASVANQYLDQDTPGSSNGSGFPGVVDPVEVSIPRGFYEAPISVALTTSTAGAQIRYTLDGSDPSAGGGNVYGGIPISISKTTVLRATATKSQWKSSPSVTHSYFFLEDIVTQTPRSALAAGFPNTWGGQTPDYGMDSRVIGPNGTDRYGGRYAATIRGDLQSIPTLSIAANVADLFGPNGLYSHSDAGGDSFERSASAELILTNGSSAFQVNAGLRVQGGAFRSDGLTKKHSLRLLFNSRHDGPSKLRYPLFGFEATSEFDTLTLRANSNDGYSWGDAGGQPLYIRDAFGRETILAMQGVASHHLFVHLYLNGLYWGLYEILERPDNAFSASYFGGSKNDWDALNSGTPTQGDTRAWDAMAALAGRGLTGNSNYFRIQGRNPDGRVNPALTNYLDVGNMSDYMIVNLYMGNSDWPPKNYWVGRRRIESTGYKFYMWDSEWTLGLRSDLEANRTTVAEGVAVPYAACRVNPEFQIQFADRLQRLFFNKGPLAVNPQFAQWDPAHPEHNRPVSRFVALTEEVRRAMVAESARWGDMHNAVPYTRDEHWAVERDTQIQNYFPYRSDVVLQQFRSIGLYPNLDAPAFSVRGGLLPPGQKLYLGSTVGKIYYTTNGADPRQIGGSLAADATEYTGPIVLNGRILVRARVLQGNVWSALDEAYFTELDPIPLRITEIHFQPAAELPESLYFSDDAEFVELKNTGNTVLSLAGIRFSKGISFDFATSSITQLGPGQHLILTRDLTAFEARYGKGLPVAGVFSGTLNNQGDELVLESIQGERIDEVSYSANWYPSTAGLGSSLVLRDASITGDLKSTAAAWRPSSRIGGSPGADDPTSTIPRVVVSEVVSRAAKNGPDTIELQNLSSQSADISGWYLTDDPNQPRKFRIPTGTILPPGAFVTWSENEWNSKLDSKDSFSLSANGDSVWLFSTDAVGGWSGWVHGGRMGASAAGESFVHVETSDHAEYWLPASNPTFQASNAAPRVGPIVISRFQSNPEPGGFAFVELMNLSEREIVFFDPSAPTNTWRIPGLQWSFPSGATLSAKGTCVVSEVAPEVFRARYGVPTSVQVWGPFLGSLQNAGETLELQQPESGSNPTRYLSVDMVTLRSSAWAFSARGSGACLSRKNASLLGVEPASWVSAWPEFGQGGTTDGLPSVTSQPASVTVVEQETAVFRVEGSGAGLLHYQWFHQDHPMLNATQAVLTLDAVTEADGGSYQVAVMNGSGTQLSQRAFLTVIRQPRFTRISGDKSVTSGSAVSLLASAIGVGGVHYQWYFNGVVIPGMTNAVLGISAVTPNESGVYQVQVWDQFGTNRSQSIQVKGWVRPTIVEPPQSLTILQGDSASFRVVASGSSPMTFRWRKGTTALPDLQFQSDALFSIVTFTNVQPAQAGKYSVQVTNGAPTGGSVTAEFQLAVLIDADRDGMADAWELLYGLDPSNPNDAGLDADGDGYSNVDEYRAGTDPRSASSQFRMEIINTLNHQVTIGWFAASNRTYSVLYRDAGWDEPWKVLKDVWNKPSSHLEQFTDELPSTGFRAYRLVTPRVGP